MRALPLTFSLLLLMPGCASTPVQGESTDERRVHYLCSNGEEIGMRLFPAQGVGVLVRGGKPIELQQQPAVSGFLYASGPNAVRGKGEELTVQIGGTVPLQCKAR